MENLYNKNWHTLNIDISTALRDTFDPDAFYEQSEFKGKPAAVWEFRNEELRKIFTDEWLLHMELLDLKIASCMIFHRQPYYIHPEIHVDAYKTHTPVVYALNWALEENDDSEMIWYDIPSDTALSDQVNPKSYEKWWMDLIPPPFKCWPMDGNYPELERRAISNIMTLVNVSIPHNVIVNKKPRWCFSVRMHKPISNWREAVEYFKPFIIT